MITIMGVDPGTARIGWGVVEEHNGKLTATQYGCITTSQSVSPEQRLLSLHREFTLLLTTHQPDEVSVEDVFFATNAKTAISVGQARGVILLAVAQHGIGVSSYSPLAVKKAICGSGSAQKIQVGRMVTKLLRLPALPKPDDTADALAIAAAHAFSYKWKTRMQTAVISGKLQTKNVCA